MAREGAADNEDADIGAGIGAGIGDGIGAEVGNGVGNGVGAEVGLGLVESVTPRTMATVTEITEIPIKIYMRRFFILDNNCNTNSLWWNFIEQASADMESVDSRTLTPGFFAMHNFNPVVVVLAAYLECPSVRLIKI